MAFAADLWFGLSTGALAMPATTVTPLFFLYLLERRRFPYKTAALALLILIPFHHTKAEYRREVWGEEQVGVVDRSLIYVDITAQAMLDEPGTFFRDATRSLQERTSYLGIFALVVRVTPERVPYWDGETYRDLPWSFVPRFVVPDKPVKNYGARFGHRYGFVDPTDHDTTVNLAQLVEMYVNFGAWGVGIGMFLLGLYYRAFYRLLNFAGAGDGSMMVAAMAFTYLLNIEGDASLILVGAAQEMIAHYVIIWSMAFATTWVMTARQRA